MRRKKEEKKRRRKFLPKIGVKELANRLEAKLFQVIKRASIRAKNYVRRMLLNYSV